MAGHDPEGDARRACRALLATLFDSTPDQQQRDDLSAEIVRDFPELGLHSMAVLARAVRGAAPPAPPPLFSNASRRHPDPIARRHADAILAAVDGSSVTTQLQRSLQGAVAYSAIDVVRDLALAAASAVMDIAVTQRRSPNDVLLWLAQVDEEKLSP